ncbi:MAG: DUF3572 domain-containing protein [Micropepsaceae bacterium]
MRIEMALPKRNAETIALEALGFIAADDAELGRFLGISGLSIDDLRASAGSSRTLLAVMEYVMGHEPTARAFAESQGYRPEDLANAAYRLGAA